LIDKNDLAYIGALTIKITKDPLIAIISHLS